LADKVTAEYAFAVHRKLIAVLAYVIAVNNLMRFIGLLLPFIETLINFSKKTDFL